MNVWDSFRAQLVIPEHRQLFEYWLSACDGRTMPCRSDIKPAEIARLLPGISLIDVAEDIPQSKVRLAGTKLREIHDREITGQTIDALDWGDKRDYWLAAYRRTVEKTEPTQGVLKGPRFNKEHLVQYWLRLPLTCNGGTHAAMILGHDYFVPAMPTHNRERRIA
ncbi:PAS domain-containing protein [Aestuariivirga litoralis]|uniref:PAS domain-containing protein n=1 Tax=Aestuariivirga litoralis TaxID=2650924 RepID=UPI0018C70A86|nr:PAS domain-containing protein [Aestuariivirga litoralis]MBG1232473.1 PAS domain-containing protein [Aestuariivirga litoralis]